MDASSIPSYVDGQPLIGSGEAFDNINPATGAVIGVVHDATSADVDAAVAARQRGFAVWSAMTATERGRILHRAAVLLRERNDELAATGSGRTPASPCRRRWWSTCTAAPTASNISPALRPP